jgi:hypothetical protein
MKDSGPSHPKPANPEKYDTWVADDGELYVFDGTAWVPYLSPPPPLSGDDPEPIAVEREFPD